MIFFWKLIRITLKNCATGQNRLRERVVSLANEVRPLTQAILTCCQTIN